MVSVVPPAAVSTQTPFIGAPLACRLLLLLLLLQVFTDARGNFHCFYHVYTKDPPGPAQCTDSTVSAHAFSEDGFEWHTAKVPPYGTQVNLSTGETVTVATRERPKPFFQNGTMTHLFNGVCGSVSRALHGCEHTHTHMCVCVCVYVCGRTSSSSPIRRSSKTPGFVRRSGVGNIYVHFIA